MEHATHTVLLHECNEGSAGLQIAQLDIEHVRIVLAALGNMWQLQKALLSKRLKCVIIGAPCCQTILVYIISMLELSPQIGRVEFGGEIARTKIDPVIFGDLAAEKLGAVGTLLTDNLRTIEMAPPSPIE